LPEGKKTVKSWIVFKKKLNEHKSQVKFKAWIVAKDFSQVSREDFTETFSSVAKFTTLHTFLTLATFLDFEIYQVDIIATYLQWELNEKIYMEILEEVGKLDSKDYYWRLKKYSLG